MRLSGDTRATARTHALALLRWLWPVAALVGILWFPFDWLATVWPAYSTAFRVLFRNEHDHFVGHTVFFLIIGLLVLAYLPGLRRRPLWYALGLVLAALVQETIQAFFRRQLPTFTDFNAFRGDALGGFGALAIVWLMSALSLLVRRWAVRHSA